MELRGYLATDCASLAELFYQTVHTVNAKDYTQQQLDAWATGQVNLAAWDASFSGHTTLVAELDGCIAGFGDMDDTGYLDHLYVHKDCQGRGVAAGILCALERQAMTRGIRTVSTHASITARPFFQRAGYHEVRENQVIRGGVVLINFVMEKDLSMGE